jgi:hypothetical protein
MRFNQLVLRLIEGPAHRLLPSGLTRISYTGPVSGRDIRFPAQSVVDGSRFLVVAGRPQGKRWWRSFRRPQRARLMRGGRQYEVIGQVLTGPERAGALTSYLAAHRGSRRLIGPETPVIAFERAPLS